MPRRAIALLPIALAIAALVTLGERSLTWDPRLDTLGVTLLSATDCASGCWRLVEARYEDENESRGLHHVWARLLDERGQQQDGAAWGVYWRDGSQTLTTKPPPDWADYALWDCFLPDQGERGGYTAHAGANPMRSDQVQGLGLPYCHHVSFRLVWQWVPAGAEATPVATVTATVGPCVGCVGRAWLPLVVR